MNLDALFDDFVNFYMIANRHDIKDLSSREGVIRRLHGGDCGTAAIAVGHVFTSLTGKEVTYYDNQRHGYIEVDGRYYDATHPFGADRHELMMGYDSKEELQSGDLEFMKERFINYDPLGRLWVAIFARKHNVAQAFVDFTPLDRMINVYGKHLAETQRLPLYNTLWMQLQETA